MTGTGALHGVDLDLHDVGELTPAVAALCALADSPVAPARHRATSAATRPTGWPRWPPSSAASAPTSPSTPTASRCGPRRCTAGSFHTYADHRMAHAGVIVGAAVDGVQVEDIATTAKTFPDFAGFWAAAASAAMTGRYSDQDDHEHYERPRRRTRPRTKERPTYDDAVDGVVVTVDRGRYTLLVDGHTVMAMKARPLGRKGVVVGDRVRVVGDTSRRRRLAGPDRRGPRARRPRCAARPTTTTRSSG